MFDKPFTRHQGMMLNFAIQYGAEVDYQRALRLSTMLGIDFNKALRIAKGEVSTNQEQRGDNARVDNHYSSGISLDC